ncbi:MAG TPA: exodeoxyribonuclease VII large subunit [Chlamydiales bacterium]|nr:exodeoxyribonuclease VII large subunit [Chlamydiales bacterium]
MKIFSVSELTFAIKSLLEPNFRQISLQGEISNFKLQTSGHLYFSLKDAGAQISAVLFKNSAATLSRIPKDGDQVIAKGELSLYMPRGQYQMVIRELQFQGAGELLLKLQKFKEELLLRGWFDTAKKKPLPKFPKKIGIITSPTGAVIQDILNILTRRLSGFHVVLNPVKVQGPGAAEEIARAIQDFNTYNLVDVLIVGRGGGSIEDLWAFNEEIVAKAIYESRIPIVSAVGHETDFTIADFVADVRAPTPSAAAELVSQEKANIFQFLKTTQNFLTQKVIGQIKQSRQYLEALKRHPLFNSPYSLLSQQIQSLDDLRSDLDAAMQRTLTQNALKTRALSQRLELLKPSSQMNLLREQLKPYSTRYLSAITTLLATKKERLYQLTEHLRSINPNSLLKKGYSILQTANGSIIQSANAIRESETFTALLHDGRITAKTNKVDTYDTKSLL